MRHREQRKCVPPRHLPAGTLITQDISVVSVLGEGGTGVVYAAQHAILRRQVAVKMSHATGPHSHDARLRLQREAQLCASVRDPHVPRIYALDQLPDGSPYVVMEKVEGVPLSAYLATTLPSLRMVCQIAMDILSGLSAVHRAGVIHRDIKPSNIIVNLAGSIPRVTLIDFGIGKVTRKSSREQLLTRRGEILGTPLYMAPEQILEGQVDARADVYATGTLLFEMLAGSAPFAAPSVAEIFVGVLRDEMPDLKATMPTIPSALMEVARTALAKPPAERFQSAEAMRAALAALEPQLPMQPRSREPSRRADSHPSGPAETPTIAWSKGRKRGLRLSSIRARREQVDVFLPTMRARVSHLGLSAAPARFAEPHEPSPG
jgi:eukaryotic-like serine/threonine-protein kinase